MKHDQSREAQLKATQEQGNFWDSQILLLDFQAFLLLDQATFVGQSCFLNRPGPDLDHGHRHGKAPE